MKLSNKLFYTVIALGLISMPIALILGVMFGYLHLALVIALLSVTVLAVMAGTYVLVELWVNDWKINTKSDDDIPYNYNPKLKDLPY